MREHWQEGKVQDMGGKRRIAGGVVTGILLAFGLYTNMAWASGGQWEYKDASNEWYYLDENGERVTGRRELSGDTYFFDKNGVMLTGWVRCPKDELPEPYTDTMDGKDIYYCGTDGKMARRWVTAYDPEQAAYDEAQQIQGIKDGEYKLKQYYFDEKGRPYQDKKKTIDEKRYIFDEEGAVMTGWLYDQGGEQTDRYLKVGTDSPEADKELCRNHPENLLYGNPEDGSLAREQWVDDIPPWDNEDDDKRSFYVDSSHYIVTGSGAKGSGTSLSARRKARKIAEIGTYRLEEWSTDVNIIRIDGKYYCLENSGTRLDGLMLLTGAGKSSPFGDGLYCFMDNAAMETGAVMIENVIDDDSDGFVYYYYFSEISGGNYSKGQGITGVSGGRLYYQGMAVGAQDDTCEVVYLPTLEEKDRLGKGTGLFLVDASGKVKKGSGSGSHYTSGKGEEYRVIRESDRNDDYGYVIEHCGGEKDEDGHKIWRSLTELDYDYICWDAVEE